jgi:hypothetical protein
LDAVFSLDSLKKNQGSFKPLAIPGGKIDFTLRAMDFGKVEEQEEEGGDDWMEFL